MSKMSYYDMNRCLCKELCCEFEKFEKEPHPEILKGIKDLVESMVGLTELEAAGAMREYLEDEHGYDSYSGEFKDRDWSKPHRVWNVARPYPMTTPPYYGGDYDIDGRYMSRGDGMDGRMNMDGTYNRGRSRDSRGRYNDGRGMDGYGIYNMAHMNNEHVKNLTDHEKQEWIDSMQNSDGTRGETFSKDEAVAIAKKVGAKFDNYSEMDFALILNAVYSDYCEALSKVDSKLAENPIVFGHIALAWLEDADSYDPEEHIARYWKYIVKH